MEEVKEGGVMAVEVREAREELEVKEVVEMAVLPDQFHYYFHYYHHLLQFRPRACDQRSHYSYHSHYSHHSHHNSYLYTQNHSTCCTCMYVLHLTSHYLGNFTLQSTRSVSRQVVVGE